MKNLILLFLVLSFIVSCKPTKKTTIKEISEEEIFTHEDKIVRNDFISGKVLDDKDKPIYPVAIKLTIDNDTCLNTYTNFDGIFALTSNISKINENSFFEFISRGYSKKTVLFNKFMKNKIVILNKDEKIITEEEYLFFHEKIRSCR